MKDEGLIACKAKLHLRVPGDAIQGCSFILRKTFSVKREQRSLVMALVPGCWSYCEAFPHAVCLNSITKHEHTPSLLEVVTRAIWFS